GLRRFECRLNDGSTLHLPAFLDKFINRPDVVRMLPPGKDDLLVERSSSGSRPQCLLYTSIGYVSPPRLSKKRGGILARVELPERAVGPTARFLSGDAMRHYFSERPDSKPPQSLYALLCVFEAATPADLRVA